MESHFSVFHDSLILQLNTYLPKMKMWVQVQRKPFGSGPGPKTIIFFFNLIFIGVWLFYNVVLFIYLFYNVVLVSIVEQKESAMHIHISHPF